MPERRATGERPLTVAVPQLSIYHPQSGIGRVFHSLRAAWGERVRVVPAELRAVPAPLLRNLPYGVRAPAGAELVLLPRLTGAQALGRAGGLPGAALVHDVGVVDFPGDAEGLDALTRLALRRSFYGLRQARRVIAVSAFSRDRLLAHLPELAGRLAVVPDGVGPLFLGYRRGRAEARARVAERLGPLPDGPIVLNVGSELPRKNMPLLLELLARLRAARPGATLVRVGAPGHPRWRERTLRAAAARGLRPGAELRLLDAGVDDELLADLYRAADVFVAASLYEGFGLPALEALAVGAPVVVTSCGALPEVVGAAGRVAPPEPDALLAAVVAALDDPQPAARAAAGRARAAALTWERSAAMALAILADLAHHTPSGAPLRAQTG